MPNLIADQKKLEELTGQTVHPDYFSLQPTGHRVHILTDRPPKFFGKVVLPDQNIPKMFAGYVMAVGPEVGQPGQPYPMGPVVEDPTSLLYKRVLFGRTSGTPILLDITQHDLWDQVLVLVDRDIQAVDKNQTPYVVRQEERGVQLVVDLEAVAE